MRRAAGEDEFRLLLGCAEERRTAAEHRALQLLHGALHAERAAGVDEHTVAEPKHIGAECAAEHGERGHVDCIRSGETNVVAAQRHIAVKHQRGDGEIPTAAVEGGGIGDRQRTVAGDEQAVKALKAGVLRAAAIHGTVAGNIQAEDATLRGGEVREGAVRRGDGEGVVQLAIPRELTVGAFLLRPATGEIGKRDALIGKLALLNEIGVRSVRQADGEVIARALVGTGGKRKIAVLVRRTGGLSKVEPQAADLGQILGVQPLLDQNLVVRRRQCHGGARRSGRAAGGEQEQQGQEQRGQLFHSGVLQNAFSGRCDPYFISSATRSVYSLGSSSGRPAMSSA